MSTINFSDVYGAGSGLGRKPGTVAANTGTDVSAANAPGVTGDTKPTMVWLGMVIALVLLRVAIEMS